MWREKQREEEIEKERKRALIREIRQLEAERIEDRNYKLPVNYSCISFLVFFFSYAPGYANPTIIYPVQSIQNKF